MIFLEIISINHFLFKFLIIFVLDIVHFDLQIIFLERESDSRKFKFHI